MSDLRKDPVSGRWVIIAKERADRPNPFRHYDSGVRETGACPFCPGNEGMTPKEIIASLSDDQNGKSKWRVRTVPNRYPALRIEGTHDLRPEGMYDIMQGIGAHEVIVETPEHKSDPSQYSAGQMVSVVQMYRDRMADLIRDLRFQYVLVFKNHGEAAGATLAHPHSQVIALPIVPIQNERELSGAGEYFKYRGRCIYCDILRQELQDGRRLVVQNGEFVAYAPFASRFPFEVHILPREHSSFFWELSSSQIERLAEILRDVLRRYKMVLKDPPYNYVIHSAPPGFKRRDRFHWTVQIMPRMTDTAGFEWGSGFYINPMPPEDAAQKLREMELYMEIPEGHLLTSDSKSHAK